MTEETALVPVEPQPGMSLGMIRVDTPSDVLRAGSDIATPLAKFIRDRKLSVTLQGKEYPLVEAWNTLGVMMGVTPHEVSVTEENGIFTAKVELRRISDGKVLASASAECGSDDEKDRWGKPTWSTRPRYARRSMAITRATAKAGRMAFAWVMTLAGYQPTPAEEMQPLVDSGVIEAHVVAAAPAPTYPTTASKQGTVAPADTIPFDEPDNTPVDGAPPEGFVYVKDVREAKRGEGKNGPWTLYVVSFSDGKSGSTFDGQMAVTARAAAASKVPVIPTLQPSGKGNNSLNLTGLVRA